MKKSIKCFYTAIIFLTLLLAMFSMSFAFAGDDTSSNTDEENTVDGERKTGTTWGIQSSGTKYTVIIDGEPVVIYLSAGTKVNDNIKGYQSSGLDILDTYGEEFNLKNGELTLEREDWIELLESQGYSELAEKIDDGCTFNGIVEQYLECGEKAQGMSGLEKYTATELKEMLESDEYDIENLRWSIEQAFNSFSEENQIAIEEMNVLEYDKTGHGFGFYSYEKSGKCIIAYYIDGVCKLEVECKVNAVHTYLGLSGGIDGWYLNSSCIGEKCGKSFKPTQESRYRRYARSPYKVEYYLKGNSTPLETQTCKFNNFSDYSFESLSIASNRR